MNRYKTLDFAETGSMPKTLSKLAWQLRKRTAPENRPYHLLIVSGEDSYQALDGYKALIRLLQGNYFSTIVITDPSLLFEYVLNEVHPQLPTYVIGHGQDEYIASALHGQTNGTCIIKLYSSSHNGYSSRLPAVISDLSEELQQSLERYLNQDIVIVGSIAHNRHVRRALREHPEGSIYYVLPAWPQRDDPLLMLMTKQGRPLEALLSGPYGETAKFFQTLEELLKAGISYFPYIVDAAPVQEQPLISNHYRTEDAVLPFVEAPQPYAQPYALLHSQPRSHTDESVPLVVAAAEKRQPSRATRVQKRTSADVLLVTVTSIETRAVLHQFPEYRVQLIQEKTYYDLGIIQNAHVFMVQSPRMGASGQGGARVTIEKGIQALSPWAVIMVGIAFGFDDKKQKIGDILVAHQIWDYESQRVGSGPQDSINITPRGDRASVSELLLDRFLAGQHSFASKRQQAEEGGEIADITFGLILSGNKLVDNKAFRDQLHMLAPDAIGGEMEGAALLEAAQGKVDWIIVKAICDWADGQKNVQKDERQRLAAENAARFTAHVLRQGGFIRPRRQKRV